MAHGSRLRSTFSLPPKCWRSRGDQIALAREHGQPVAQRVCCCQRPPRCQCQPGSPSGFKSIIQLDLHRRGCFTAWGCSTTVSKLRGCTKNTDGRPTARTGIYAAKRSRFILRRINARLFFFLPSLNLICLCVIIGIYKRFGCLLRWFKILCSSPNPTYRYRL